MNFLLGNVIDDKVLSGVRAAKNFRIILTISNAGENGSIVAVEIVRMMRRFFAALTPDSTWARVWRSHMLDKLLVGNKEKKEEISNKPHHLFL